MSEYRPDGTPIPKPTDPVVKVLIGCGLIALGIVVLAVIVAFGIGWRLTRDETPGRAAEGFLLGDETSYWCFELKPHDPGVATALQKIHEQAEAARDEALKNSPLGVIGSFRRPNQLAEMLPLKVELAAAPDTWSGRVSFSRGTWRMRMAVKLMRWVLGRASEGGGTREVDGVTVTTLPDPRGKRQISFAMVGNRILVAGNGDRLARALDTSHGEAGVRDPRLDVLHDAVRLEGEDGWAFAAGPSVASFDVNEQDDLRFRIAGPAPVDARETPASELALARVRAFLPYFRDDVFVMDPGSPATQPDGSWTISGRVPDVSAKVAAVLLRFSASRTEGSTEPRTPSANPTPPSPPTSSDPRSDTPAAPKRGETPSPAH